MCIIQKGCCGLSLRTSCLVIAIFYLVCNIISFMCTALANSHHNIHISGYRTNVMVTQNSTYVISPGYLTITNLTCSILSILMCVSIILAASFENIYLVIPWFIGYAVTIVQFLIAFVYFLTRHRSMFDFTWHWEFDDDDNDGNLRRRINFLSNENNGSQSSRKYTDSIWNVFEPFLKLAFESSVLCYAISYFMELRQLDSEAESSNRQTNR